MNKKLSLIIIVVVFLGIFGGLIIAYFEINKNKPVITTEVVKATPTETLIGGDKDEKGCLIAAGYSWCEEKQKCLRVWEEPCNSDDKISNIQNVIFNITNQTQVEFTDPEEFTFDWNYKSDENIQTIKISGQKFTALNLNNEQSENVFEFFKENEFEVDQYNVSAGVVAASTGFVRNEMYCIYSYVMSDYDSTNENYTPSPNASKNVEIKCGYYNELNITPTIQASPNFVEINNN